MRDGLPISDSTNNALISQGSLCSIIWVPETTGREVTARAPAFLTVATGKREIHTRERYDFVKESGAYWQISPQTTGWIRERLIWFSSPTTRRTTSGHCSTGAGLTSILPLQQVKMASHADEEGRRPSGRLERCC